MVEVDVAIIGGGIGGLMTAHRIKKLNPNKKVLIIEKGRTIENRKCAAQNGKPCAHCDVCSITSGYAGAGAFSDGKFNLGTAYGGTLGDELGEDVAMKYIAEVDDILATYANNQYDNYPEIYKSNKNLKLKCLQNNLQLLDMDVRHLGTDRNMRLMQSLIKHLNDIGVIMWDRTEVSKVKNVESKYVVECNYTDTVFSVPAVAYVTASNVVFAVGRGGSKFLTSFCKDNNIPMRSNAVDIGVRVEMKDTIWDEFSSKIYEPKILCKTRTFEDKTRMFCFNKGGIVSAENNNGVITANGHSYSDDAKKTDNCNFAILTSINFTEPFNQPIVLCNNVEKQLICLFPCEARGIVGEVGTFLIDVKTSGIIHTISAIIFFGLLAYNSIFLFTKGSETPTENKKLRNIIYRACGVGMLLSFLILLSPGLRIKVWLMETIFTEKVQRHSQKPEISYEIINRLYPNLKKLELYARAERDGFDVWGNEVPVKED